jgi:hypothetical protein
MAKLTLLVETLKTAGLSATECSRIRQYECWVCETFKILRQIKMYCTPQALRSFARIFCFATRRMAKLTLLVETLKTAGLSATECSRIRQYECWVCETFEILRQIKMYCTPQALRSFARIFMVFLPPFYAPRFAQIAIDVDSLGVGPLLWC